MSGFLPVRGGGGGAAFGSLKDESEFVEISDSSGGSGVPLNFAMATRIYLIAVYIPKIEPKVSRKFPNCSARNVSPEKAAHTDGHHS